MAAYADLEPLFRDETLLPKIAVAVAIAADAIMQANPADTAERRAWAAKAARDSRGCAEEMLPLLVAQNAAASTNAILNATDTAIQTSVNNAVDLFADNPG